ncbi:cyclophilin family peptidyl-prolyl cis-trans isomerase [Dysgonomonadaceae bacterium PH5-43]|nr:cyclophilin family peptidyl-prolyl cis-trans isomerase [Dysgonomonadaceae bacterium PH5-43]
MKIQNLLIAILFIATMTMSCKAEEPTYTIETTMGNIKIKLYEETPLHKANFEKLVEDSTYNGVLFHRIISGFMIQTGNPATKKDNEGYVEDENTRIPAEFVEQYYHKRGAIAAARMGDFVNPEKKSSSTQFYIVQGIKYTRNDMSDMEAQTGKTWTKEQKEVYRTEGGAPFLDGDYTVFGEVVEGMDIVDNIAAMRTGPGDYPLADIRIISISKN